MSELKCPECGADINMRFDCVEFNEKNEPAADIYVACTECDFAEDVCVDNGTNSVNVNWVDMRIRTYHLLDAEGEVDRISDCCLEGAIDYFSNNFEGKYTIKAGNLSVKVDLK
jgi:hypothetical protein